ncbi:MAG: hypothetical protein WBH51_01920 [Mycolicibacter algericus]|uniref:hypothetical protein n=1 Tax=Mycolicibacter algericus TaxID=1288388 RepID=UPI003C722994
MNSKNKPLRSVMKPVGDEWMVLMEWPDGVEDGGPARLVIEPIDKMPVGGLSSTVLRKIDFREAIEEFREQVAASDRRAHDYEALRKFERDQLLSALAEGVTDRYLAMLSWHYVRAAERGQANINDYLAELVGKPVGTVRGHLIRARHDGLLSGSHGRKGGELSAEAERLIETFADEWLKELDRLTHAPATGRSRRKT